MWDTRLQINTASSTRLFPTDAGPSCGRLGVLNRHLREHEGGASKGCAQDRLQGRAMTAGSRDTLRPQPHLYIIMSVKQSGQNWFSLFTHTHTHCLQKIAVRTSGADLLVLKRRCRESPSLPFLSLPQFS